MEGRAHEGSRRDPTLPPGTRIGVYDLVRQLGAGSFGTVYEARHARIGKRAAIKVLSRRFSSEPEEVARFVAEARVVNEIRHGNIVDIFDFGELPDGRQYCVMEFLEGSTLADVLARRGALPPGEAVALLRQIASALDAAHRCGVTHRDVKPANVIVVAQDGRVEARLIDFGIAKLADAERGLDQRTLTGAIVGTPRYMAPEQCRGRPADPRSDVYAWGLVAFEVLTGATPFDGADPLELMLRHATMPPPRPSEVNPALPPGVDGPVLAALRKDPSERPGQLLPLVDEVEAALREPPRRVRHGTAALIAAVAVLALLSMLAAVLLRGDPSAAHAPPPAPPRAHEPAPPAPPARIAVTLEGTPPGTRVRGPGGIVGIAPGTLLLPRGDEPVVLELSRAGFLPARREFVPREDVRLTVALRRERRAQARPDPDSVERPDVR